MGTVALAAHFAWRTAELYAEPTTLVVGSLAGAAIARARRDAPAQTPSFFYVAAFAVGAATAVPFSFYGDHAATAFVLGTAVAAITAAAVHAACGSLRWALALGFVRYVANPLRCLVAGTLALGAAWLGARGGHLRYGLGVAAALAVVATAYPAPYAFLQGRPFPQRRVLTVIACAFSLVIAASFVVTERVLPLAELEIYVGEVVHARDGTSHRYVVVAAPAGHELFEDAALVSSPLDDAVYARALTEPAQGRALLLFGGEGRLERALLAAPRLPSLTVVIADAELPRVAAKLPGAVPLTDPRLHVELAEPFPWLLSHAARAGTFDVIVANLPPPMDHRAGKYYTQYFFEVVKERLAPGGVVVFPATSAFASHGAFESILATARAAGLQVEPRHVSVPALGVASFMLGRREATSSARLHGLDRGLDLASRQDGTAAHLYDQRVVDAFAGTEEQAAPK